MRCLDGVSDLTQLVEEEGYSSGNMPHFAAFNYIIKTEQNQML